MANALARLQPRNTVFMSLLSAKCKQMFLLQCIALILHCSIPRLYWLVLKLHLQYLIRDLYNCDSSTNMSQFWTLPFILTSI
jgi:hypothetical protein